MPLFDKAVFVETGPLAVAAPPRQYVCPIAPVMAYVQVNVPELPPAMEEMLAGDGPATSVSAAPPAHEVSALGATFTSAEVPLFVTVMSTVTVWPEMMLEGVTVMAAVKLPMVTVLEFMRMEDAVASEFCVLALK